MLLTVGLTQRWETPIVAALCTILVAVGGFLSPPGARLTYAIANSGVSLVAIWVTAYVVLRFRNSQHELADLNKALEERVERRTSDAQLRAAELTEANKSLEHEISQRERAEVAARNSQAMYASLVEDLPIPIIRKDAQGKFLFANRASLFLGGAGAGRHRR